MTITAIYETSARASGGREGHVSTLDGSLSLKMGAPAVLGGSGEGNNPEQLFAAGYAACFLNALKFTALREKSPFPADAEVTATIGIGQRPQGGYGLTAAMAVTLPGMEQDAAQALVAKAHGTCPYSNATRNNLDVHFSVNGAMSG